MTVLSWLAFSWLYGEGKLDQGADRKTASAELKALRKAKKAEKKAEKKNGVTIDQDYMFDKWMWFGGGFYGLAALWTFIVVELMDLGRFLWNLPTFITTFDGGVMGFIGDFIVNQIGNIVSAFVWFNYWSHQSVILAFLVAWIGYWLGNQLAKRVKPAQIFS